MNDAGQGRRHADDRGQGPRSGAADSTRDPGPRRDRGDGRRSDRDQSGDTLINVYRSEFAGTNKATALTFDVDDIEAEVRELKDKGIFFEHYDMPGLEQPGDLYVGEGMKTAWFKDPDGNILSLFEGKPRLAVATRLPRLRSSV